LGGQAELREALGSEVLMHFSVSARAAVTEEVRELAADVGDDRAMKQLASDERATLVGRFSPATRIREGDTIDVAVEEGALHFCDPSTREAIYDDAADRVALS
jgi:multiple sugar transport system ATP-binding protein